MLKGTGFDSLSGKAMTRFGYSFGLSVVLLIPEPATFALLVFSAVCLVAVTLRTAAGRITGQGGSAGDAQRVLAVSR